jgi:hypothetical protein
VPLRDGCGLPLTDRAGGLVCQLKKEISFDSSSGS